MSDHLALRLPSRQDSLVRTVELLGWAGLVLRLIGQGASQSSVRQPQTTHSHGSHNESSGSACTARAIRAMSI